MPEPLATSIATAVATGATAALSDGVRALITKLASVVRERLGRNSSDQDTLDAAASAPQDDTTVHRLAQVLEQRMHEDPAFDEQVRALWSAISDAKHRDEVTNVIHGPVHGSVVQARDVQGGITFNAPPPQE